MVGIKRAIRVIFGQCRQQRVCQMRHQIDAHQIHKAKHACLWDTCRSAHDGICRFDRNSCFNSLVNPASQPEHAEAVGNKAGGIVTRHYTLTQFHVTEMTDIFDRVSACVITCDQFQKSHVARRVKEVRDQKVFGKFIALILHQ